VCAQVHVGRKADKLRYRYPSGESYQDVIQRVEPVVIEAERERESVVIIAHQAILRVLYGYFMKIDLEKARPVALRAVARLAQWRLMGAALHECSVKRRVYTADGSRRADPGAGDASAHADRAGAAPRCAPALSAGALGSTPCPLTDRALAAQTAPCSSAASKSTSTRR